MGLFSWCLSGRTWRWSSSSQQTGQEFYEMKTGEVNMCMRAIVSFNYCKVPSEKCQKLFQGWCGTSSEKRGQKDRGNHQTQRNWGLFQPLAVPCSPCQLCMEEVSFYGAVLSCFLWVLGALSQFSNFLRLRLSQVLGWTVLKGEVRGTRWRKRSERTTKKEKRNRKWRIFQLLP